MNKPQILISIDVEEFDLPLEYGQQISLHEQLDIGYRGLTALMPVFEKLKIPTTLFTTAQFAKHYPDVMHTLAQQHEIASHTFYHSQFNNEDLLQSRLELERICKVPVIGLRIPRMRKVEIEDIRKAGYLYDSSLNPTWIPGRYNNLFAPRTIFNNEQLTIVPASVSPLLRLPLFWLAFKNYPYTFFLNLCKKIIKNDGYLCLYFHPWEFTSLQSCQIPKYTKRIDGKALIERLEMLLNELALLGNYSTIQSYLTEKNFINNYEKS